MRAKLHHLESDVRFWLWKARTVHAGRWVALVTILAVVLGVTDYSLNLVQKAKAANTATINYSSKNVTIDGGHYLIDQNRCLWAFDINSSIQVVQGGGVGNLSNFKGRTCLTDPVSGLSLKPDVTVKGGGILEVMGQGITFKSLAVSEGSKVTTPPADANGMSVPYPSRNSYFATRFTGFIRFDAPSSGQKTYVLKPSQYISGFGGTKSDLSTIYIAFDPLSTNVDSASFGIANNYTFGDSGVTNCANMATSFFSGSCFDGRTGTLNAARKDADLTYTMTAGQPAFYMPIQISAWTTARVTLDQTLSIDYAEKDVSGNLIGGTPPQLPTNMLYAPIDSVSSNVGNVDTAASSRMRFEYGFDQIGSNGTNIERDLSNSGAYGFFSRINLSQSGGTLSSPWGVTTNTFVLKGPFFANNNGADGVDYLLGQEGATDQDTNMQRNYKLQNHDDTSNGEVAGLNVTVSNDLNVTNSSIDVTGKGLPGGTNIRLNNTDHGFSGIGGKGGNDIPGWASASSENSGDPGAAGSDYFAITGGPNGAGGGGAAGKTHNYAGLGGGGGGIGFGAGGRTITTQDGGITFKPNRVDNNTGIIECEVFACFRGYGAGGGGYLGTGGKPTDDLNDNISGTSNRTSYLPILTNHAMGGGGAQGTCGEDSHFNVIVSPDAQDGGDINAWNSCHRQAGAGGGIINMTVGGAISLTSSKIAADGQNGYYVGAGGGGSIDIAVTGGFDMPNNSSLSAQGGTVTAICGHYAYEQNNTNLTYLCAIPGAGGGGLIKVRSASYTGNGWPGNYCSVLTYPSDSNKNTIVIDIYASDPFANISVSSGQEKYSVLTNFHSDKSTSAQSGLFDINICNGSAVAVSMAKQIQQLSSGVTWDDASYNSIVSNDADWSNVTTVIPGSRVRVVLTIVNTVANSSAPGTITDVLPVQGMTVGSVITQNAAADPIVSQSGDVLTMSSLKMNKNTTVRLMYSGVLPSPF